MDIYRKVTKSHVYSKYTATQCVWWCVCCSMCTPSILQHTHHHTHSINAYCNTTHTLTHTLVCNTHTITHTRYTHYNPYNAPSFCKVCLHVFSIDSCWDCWALHKVCVLLSTWSEHRSYTCVCVQIVGSSIKCSSTLGFFTTCCATHYSYALQKHTNPNTLFCLV